MFFFVLSGCLALPLQVTLLNRLSLFFPDVYAAYNTVDWFLLTVEFLFLPDCACINGSIIKLQLLSYVIGLTVGCPLQAGVG